ncbi:WGxxGxxG family protein [Deinococcus frigens]|uniref:WGxxGxxG family protein n=1 Tax=Deinococcus frigens TaxID=249403 RepID=UPI00049767C7|nr:WGxxGxxG family protein [Deinococcus frigens]
MKKALLLSLALLVYPVASAQDTTSTETSTTTAPLDPNSDGVIDTNNNGRADTREFPWGLLGLLGLIGLAGANRRTVTPVQVDTRDTTRL